MAKCVLVCAQAIRACYNIHLVSRNQVNKTTARATLTQVCAKCLMYRYTEIGGSIYTYT
jgi:hypothetical protein